MNVVNHFRCLFNDLIMVRAKNSPAEQQVTKKYRAAAITHIALVTIASIVLCKSAAAATIPSIIASAVVVGLVGFTTIAIIASVSLSQK